MDCDAILQTQTRVSKLVVVQIDRGIDELPGVLDHADGGVSLHLPHECGCLCPDFASLSRYVG